MDIKLEAQSYIKEIFIKDLFGHYTYSIPKNKVQTVESPMHIIYGDNGSGKTTILDLVFSLLSTVNGDGRKSKISETIFSEIKIKIAGNNDEFFEVIAKRESVSRGSYDYIIKKNNKELIKVSLIADDNCSIRINKQSDDDKNNFIKILDFIRGLNMSVFLLSDDRKMLSGSSNVEHNYLRKHRPNSNSSQNYNRAIRARNVHDNIDYVGEEEDELQVAMKELENWIRKKAFIASRKGERNANTIYEDIVKRIIKSRKDISNIDKKAIKLKSLLEDIRNRSAEFYKNGLLSKIESEQIENALETTSSNEKLQIVYNVIEPYAEGLLSRLDSLQPIQEKILAFENIVNSYLINKTLSYNVSKGFQIIYTNSEDPIELNMLSSGERQLLLLFCYVITASEEATIFIIDEPEISLNIKWQRKLGESLLELSKGSQVQFILATHSIELLHGHKECVSKLINEK